MNQSLVPVNTKEVKEIASSLAASGFFKDASSANQAFAKVLAGAELGLPAFQSMSGIHIVQGKPQLGAGLIASLIKRSTRYNYRVTELTDEACSIEFLEKFGDKWESAGVTSMTFKQAKEAGLTVEWDREKKQWRDKVTWKNFPKNMLFARCMSNGAKWFCPDVFGGPVYTEGELEETNVVVDTTAIVVEETAPPAAKESPEAHMANAINEQLQDIENIIQDVDTPQGFKELLSRLNVGVLAHMSKKDKIQWFEYITEWAAQKGIDYDRETKNFFVRPEPAVQYDPEEAAPNVDALGLALLTEATVHDLRTQRD